MSEIDLTPDQIDRAFAAQKEREESWLSETHVARGGKGTNDPWGQALDGPQQQSAAPAEKDPAWARAQQLAVEYGTDFEDLEAYLEDDALSDLPPGQRYLAAVQLEAADRLAWDGRYEDALKVVASGENAERLADLLHESQGDEFTQWVHEAAAGVTEKNADAIVNAVKEGIANHKSLQSPEAQQVLASMLESSGIDPTTQGGAHAKQLVEAAARAMDQAAVEADRRAVLAAFDQSVAQTPGAITETGEGTREIWQISGELSPAERELQRERDELIRVGQAALFPRRSAQDEVEEAWQDTVQQQDDLASEWDATMSAVRERHAREQAEEARG